MAQQRLLYVVGARPNFVKMAPVVAELQRRRPDAEHVVVHTGQHYDAGALGDLHRPARSPASRAHRLDIGSGSHAEQTARTMQRLEQVVAADPPDLAFVPGDVNSTLAAALVLVKLGVPYAHVESGLRSFDRSMPEEINRIVADEFADYLFAHSDDAVENLRQGGNRARAHPPRRQHDDRHPLPPRADVSLDFGFAEQLELSERGFVLVTLHRPSLVDGRTSWSGARAATDGRGAHARRLPGASAHAGPHPGARALSRRPLSRARSAISSSSRWRPMRRPFSPTPAASRRRRRSSACRASRCAAATERPVTTRLGTNVVLGLDPSRIPEIVDAIDDPAERQSQRPAAVGRARLRADRRHRGRRVWSDRPPHPHPSRHRRRRADARGRPRDGSRVRRRRCDHDRCDPPRAGRLPDLGERDAARGRRAAPGARRGGDPSHAPSGSGAGGRLDSRDWTTTSSDACRLPEAVATSWWRLPTTAGPSSCSSGFSGYVPRVSHRYSLIPNGIQWCRRRRRCWHRSYAAGRLVQVTAASLDGRLGTASHRRRGHRLVAAGLAHMVASDAHGSRRA